MFVVFDAYYDDVTRERFDADLANKHDVIVLRDEAGAIRGFSTLAKLTVQIDGHTHHAVFSGDTVVDEAFWGTRVLGRIFLAYMFRQRLRHPFARLWWFLISKGYKTYLLMANNFPEHWPRHERPIPDARRQLLDSLANELFPAYYDAPSGLIRFPAHHGRLRKGMAATDRQLLADNPRVRFFETRNPDWAEGVELACIASMSWTMPLRYALKAALRLPLRPRWSRRRLA
ncbi:MAG: hypothetical protein AAF211_29050, partial [Myxococcota bacterium]